MSIDWPLPKDPTCIIFGLLEAKDVARCACVCKKLNRFSKIEHLWKNFIVKDSLKPLPDGYTDPRKYYVENNPQQLLRKRAYQLVAKNPVAAFGMGCYGVDQFIKLHHITLKDCEESDSDFWANLLHKIGTILSRTVAEFVKHKDGL